MLQDFVRFLVLGLKESAKCWRRISKMLQCCIVFCVLNSGTLELTFFLSFNFHADVDECLTSPCATNANCTNVVGSYTCQCLDGYTGDGLSCEGKRL